MGSLITSARVCKYIIRESGIVGRKNLQFGDTLRTLKPRRIVDLASFPSGS